MKRLFIALILLYSSALAQDTLTGLVLAYKTQAGSGTSLTDSSSFANTGTITGATWTTSGITPLTNALVYASSSTHSDAANNTNTNFTNAQAFSVSAWIKTTSGTAAQAIIGTLDTTSSFKGWEFSLGSGGSCTTNPGNCLQVFIVNTFPSNSIQVIVPGTKINANTLYHVVVTYDGSSTAAGVNFYLNGVLLTGNNNTQNSLSATSANTKDVRIGLREDGTSTPFIGDVAATYVYNRVLAQADVTSLYNSPYTLAAVVPPSTYSPVAGGYSGTQTVTVTNSLSGSAIVYCIDTSNSCTPSTSYTTPVSVSIGSYLRAQASKSGYTTSSVTSGLYRTSIINTYYVATAGSDSNSGTSTGSPWQTISKADNWNYLPGESLQFNGGDTFSTGAPVTAQGLCIGTQAAPSSITSYGTGLATISAGSGTGLSGFTNGNALSTGVGDGIDLVNAEFCTVSNLNITGAGYTGTPPSITILNYAVGLQLATTRTSGNPLRNITFSPNLNISGFAAGINLYASPSNSSTGFNTINISYDTLTSNLVWSVLAIAGCDLNSSKTQFKSVYLGHLNITNMPGNPNGSSSLPVTGSEALNLCNMTGVFIEDNYINEGNYHTGTSSGGGACSLAISNSTDAHVIGNEITGTTNYGLSDGCAMDFDADLNNSEAAYNLTYNNMGPAFQQGSITGNAVTTTNKIHHNISYNDVRGYSASSIEGVFRFWVNGVGSSNSWVYNNSVYIGSGYFASSTPSMANFETSSSTGITFANNIFKTNVASLALFHNLSGTTSPQFIGNVYDSSGTALSFSSATSITSLSAWQAVGTGYENLNGITYGSTGAASFANLSGFSPPTNGFISTPAGLIGVLNFNLLSGSAAIGAGVDPELVGTFLGWRDFHGSYARTGAPVDMGASAYIQLQFVAGPGSTVIQ